MIALVSKCNVCRRWESALRCNWIPDQTSVKALWISPPVCVLSMRIQHKLQLCPVLIIWILKLKANSYALGGMQTSVDTHVLSKKKLFWWFGRCRISFKKKRTPYFSLGILQTNFTFWLQLSLFNLLRTEEYIRVGLITTSMWSKLVPVVFFVPFGPKSEKTLDFINFGLI